MLMRNAERNYGLEPVKFEMTASAIANFSAFVTRWIETFRHNQRLAVARASLATLSDRTLIDIGLSRADVGPRFSDIVNRDIEHRGL